MCVMCEITGRDYSHTHNLPISEVTTVNGVVQLEYPHILQALIQVLMLICISSKY
jgi:hypothetical protein